MEKDIDIRQAIETISRELTVPECKNPADFISRLSVIINEMIEKDFNRLISILYRLDVSEVKLRHLLQQEKEANAGQTIATLIFDRQLEKQKSRRNFSRDNYIDEDEKW